MPQEDDGEQHEYGDVETHATDADTSDFSPHQSIAPDEARDPMGSDDSEQDAASNDAARSKILSAEVFDSEDVPSPDNGHHTEQSAPSTCHRRTMVSSMTCVHKLTVGDRWFFEEWIDGFVVRVKRF